MIFFDVVQLTYLFIEGSAVRHATLNKHQLISIYLCLQSGPVELRQLRLLKHNYLAILLAQQEIIDATKLPKIRANGCGSLFQLKLFEFILGFEMMEPVLCIKNRVSKSLQNENMDLSSAMTNINSLQSNLLSFI